MSFWFACQFVLSYTRRNTIMAPLSHTEWRNSNLLIGDNFIPLDDSKRSSLHCFSTNLSPTMIMIDMTNCCSLVMFVYSRSPMLIWIDLVLCLPIDWFLSYPFWFPFILIYLLLLLYNIYIYPLNRILYHSQWVLCLFLFNPVHICWWKECQ